MIKREELCEFVGQLIDVVEDFLEEKGVSFPETRQLMIDAGCSEEEVEENDVILYGDNYDAIAGPFEAMLINWGLVEIGEKNNGNEFM